LFALGGNHISYRGPADRHTALTKPIWQLSRMPV
jgi:hypothetical protein